MADEMNREKLEAWLKDRPREVAVAIAARAALRLMPFYASELDLKISGRNVNDVLIRWLRCNLSSGVAVTCSNLDMIAGSIAHAVSTADPNYAAIAIDPAIAPNSANATRAAYAAVNAASAARAKDNITSTQFVSRAELDSHVAAAAAWKSIAEDADALASGIEPAVLLGMPIWPNGVPDELVAYESALLRYFSSTPSMGFWGRWYERMRDGDPMNWEMQTKIVLIDNEIWEVGAEAVADKIAKIEARYTKPQLPQDALRAQAFRLIEQAATSELSALELADRIETALTNHATESGNALPEELEILARLPRTLRTIARVVQNPDTSGGRIEELEAQVAQYAAEIQVLSEKLEAAEAACVTSLLKKSFLEQAGKSLGDWKLYAAIVTGAYAMLGGEIFGMTVGNMSETVKELFKGGGASDAPRKLPQIGVPPSS